MVENTPGKDGAWWSRGLRFFERLLGLLFQPPAGRLGRLVSLLVFAGLALYGVRLWGVFFSWGNISFDFLDWAEVAGPRYALLKDAATKGLLPLHAGNITALRGVTDRYFSIADTPFSPQYLLLAKMEMGRYIFLDTMLFYGLGCIGLALIAWKYRLSPFAFTLLFLLFNFNGYLTSHFAVGHANWTATFLLPYFILLALHLVEKQSAGWRWVLGLSLLELVVLLQGGFHQFLWCLIFLTVLALFNWRLVRPVVLGGVFTILLSLGRLLPPALALAGVQNEYLGGFPSVTDLIDGLIVLRDPGRAIHALTDTFPLNAWETDFYIGLLGLALLLVFGVLVPLARDRSKSAVHVQMLIPSLVLAVFSIGEMYAKVTAVLHVPPLTGERVTSRMLILPLVAVLVLAVIFLQRTLNERTLDRRGLPAWGQILALMVGYLMFHDLNQHLQAWRIRYLDAMTNLFPKVPFNPAQHTIANHADPVYTGMLAGGAAVGVIAMAFLVLMSLRQPKPQMKTGEVSQ